MIDVVERNAGRIERYDVQLGVSSLHTPPHMFSGLQRNSFAEKKALPYRTLDDAYAIAAIGNHLYEYCPTIKHLVNTLASYVLGKGVEYFPKLKKDICPGVPKVGESVLKKIKCSIDDAMTVLSWPSLQHEWLTRRYSNGDVFRRCSDDGNKLKVRYVEWFNVVMPDMVKYDLVKVPAADIARYADFGILYKIIETDVKGKANFRTFDRHTPEWYFIEHESLESDATRMIESVPADEIQHSKYGVNCCDPRGVTPWLAVYCNALGITDLQESGREMALARAGNAVLEYYDAKVTNADLQQMVSDEAIANKRREEAGRKKHLVGAKLLKKNSVVEFPSLNLSAKDILELINEDKHTIGSQIDAPDWLVTGKSDIGNVNTTENTGKPWSWRIVNEQLTLKSADEEILWKWIAADIGLSPIALEAYKASVEIVSSGYPDPTINIVEETNRQQVAVNAGAQSPQGFARAINNDPETVLKEICEFESSGCMAPVRNNNGGNNTVTNERVAADISPNGNAGV